ncbi:A/G-specific adenine glycosylase [Ectothiorhodospira mobilis]|uniref:A/G-specific adenine glycosylase n=1 Tax=Ectothiorhodospira mobilis TaxID=195064 RepID=UPI001EE918FE|nr:A/G-specific adenine glycosylase [Ectothiorhodospira mobilis]MCG5534898.1 A/G-specific adenine glycosylase [Ectothiorhodospira mobilis]
MTASAEPRDFAPRLLAWFDRHGRHDLPWQQPATPYRVWVSEIMLQQTRVATVIPYYRRFMARFPGVGDLADAPLDEVLHHWSGLGYYARARNLHKAARCIVDVHGGRFPRDREALSALPGIGRSTAAAILALAFGDREAILDGNVRRVLARHRGVEGWTGSAAVQARLWTLAEALTPVERVADYTQAIMDLGATVCTRRNPACGDCPLAADCIARAHGLQERLPTPRPRRAQPLRRTTMLLVTAPEGVLLERRPPAGLWGGLWGLPEVESDGAGEAAQAWCRRHLGADPLGVQVLPPFVHTFTHFRLEITPVQLRVKAPAPGVMEAPDRVWYNGHAQAGLGLAAPVSRLLQHVMQDDGEDDDSHGEMRCAG